MSLELATVCNRGQLLPEPVERLFHVCKVGCVNCVRRPRELESGESVTVAIRVESDHDLVGVGVVWNVPHFHHAVDWLELLRSVEWGAAFFWTTHPGQSGVVQIVKNVNFVVGAVSMVLHAESVRLVEL